MKGRRVQMARRIDHGRAVMMDYQPTISVLLEDIGRQYHSGSDFLTNTAGNILVERNPRDRVLYLDLHLSQHETNLLGVVEYPPPASYHKLPAPEESPSGMNTLDIIFVRPDFLHFFNIETLEGAIECLVRFGDFLLFFALH